VAISDALASAARLRLCSARSLSSSNGRPAASTACETSEPNGNPPSPIVASEPVRTAAISVRERSASLGSPRTPGVAARVRSAAARWCSGTTWVTGPPRIGI
jgi:hypothetical protein